MTLRFAFLIAIVMVLGCSREPAPARKASSPERTTEADRAAVADLPAVAGHLLLPSDLDELRRRGLTDPVPQIVDSLIAHREVIPYEGVLGGTMGFYYPQFIHVLNSKWVYARFDDGHVGGQGVFEFSIRPDSSFAWKVAAAMAD